MAPLFSLLLVCLVVCVCSLLSVCAQFSNTSLSANPVLLPNYSNVWLYLSPLENESGEFSNIPTTIRREGSAYGDEAEEYAFFAGGAILQSSSGYTPIAYSDVWILNLGNKAFTQCTSAPLPTTLYYGAGEWLEATESFVIYGGITSSPGSSTEAYFNGLYVITFSNPGSCTGAVTTTVSPSGTYSSMPGRKFHSIEIIDHYMFVFGGYNANSPLQQNQLWFKMAIDNTERDPNGNPYPAGTILLLSTSSQFFPIGIIEPAIVEDEAAFILFFYSGLTTPYNTPGSVFAPAGYMYRYDWERDLWLQPITPYLGQSSKILGEYPHLAYSCHTHTADDEHWFFAGGTDNAGNALDYIVHVDMSTDSTVGIPTMTVLYSELPEVGLEHCAIALGLGGQLVVWSGYSEGIDLVPTSVDPAMGVYPAAVFLAFLPFLAPTVTVDSFSTFGPAEDATAEWAVTGRPAKREGAGYGTDGTTVYFAGGAFLTAETVLVYTDVWGLNAVTDAYVSYPVSLPGPTYFGASQFYSGALFVWGGRSNTQGSGSFNTYSNSLYKVDFTRSPPVASTVSLSRPLQGTMYPGSVLLGQLMYIWGGTSGYTGTSTNPTQQWFSINLVTGQVRIEIITGIDFPGTIWVSPVLFTCSAGRYIYLYSGMSNDYATWGDPYDIFIYDTTVPKWVEDVEPLVSPYSALTPQFPNMAFGAITRSSDGNHVLIVGGSEGDTSVNGAGSHAKIFHIDVTPMLNGNGATGRPIISILPTTLLQPVQNAVAGLTKNNNEIVVWGGANYFNSEIPYPVSYSQLLQEVLQAGTDTPSTSGTTVVNNYYNSGGGTSLSGGQVAGYCAGTGTGHPWKRGFTREHDSSSEMSSRA